MGIFDLMLCFLAGLSIGAVFALRLNKKNNNLLMRLESQNYHLKVLLDVYRNCNMHYLKKAIEEVEK